MLTVSQLFALAANQPSQIRIQRVRVVQKLCPMLVRHGHEAKFGVSILHRKREDI